MGMHNGVDDTLRLIHSIDTAASSVHDIVPTDKLPHTEAQRVSGEAGYFGIQKTDVNKLKVGEIKASVRANV